MITNPQDEMIIRVFVLLLVMYGTSLHEMGHAYVATWLGDPTPGRAGRLTWNPIPHLDPVLTAIILPSIMFLTGNGLLMLAQTPIDPSRFRKPLRDHALVAVAGPVMNIALMLVMIGILWILYFAGALGMTYTTVVLYQACFWNLILAVFNMLPLPPLDGYWIARPILPLEMRRTTDGFAKNPMAFIVVMLVGGTLLNHVIGPFLRLFLVLLPPMPPSIFF